MTFTASDATALLTGLLLGSGLVGVVLYIWIAFALSRVFRKSGIEAWKAWVPFLNVYEFLQLGGFNGWLVLLMLVPGLGQIAVAVLMVISAHRINRAFGFGGGMTVLAALLFPVWASVLGFGSARWLGRERAWETGPVRGSDVAPVVSPASPTSLAPMTSPEPYLPAVPGVVATPVPVFPPTGAVAPPLPAAPALPPVPPLPPLPVTPAAPAESEPAPEPVPVAEPVDAPVWTPPAAPVVAPARPAVPPAVPVQFDAPASRAIDPEDLEGIDDPISESDVDFAPVTRAPAPAPTPVEEREPWEPRHETEGFPESSGEVSAVVGSPDAGEPRSARASVSALHTQANIPDEIEDLDETVVTRRKPAEWVLVPPSGRSIELTSDVVILGRRPSFDPDFAAAQLVPIDDDTRTISKTHARLELHDDRWHVTDLGSTNGVMLTTVLGTEVEASPGAELAIGERFLLGDAEVRLERSAE